MIMGNNYTQVFAGKWCPEHGDQDPIGQIVRGRADRGAALREALAQRMGAICSNPNLTEMDKFGAVKTLEEALDTSTRLSALWGLCQCTTSLDAASGLPPRSP